LTAEKKTMAKTVKGRVGWAVVKKLLKSIPVIGTVFTIGFAGHEIKKKGLAPGAVHVGLDVIPVVGTAKNMIEIVTGDWIPDKASSDSKVEGTTQQPAERAEEFSPGQVKRSPG
jgi:hypothetical protein